MAPEEPLPGIFRISVPTPYAVGPVNCYLLDGPEPALVDCGPATPEAEAALRAGLAALRVPPRDLARIVLTHHHPDHAGGLGWLLRETAAPVSGHPSNDLWLLHRPDLLAERLAWFADFYRACGVQADAAGALRRRYTDYDHPLTTRPIDDPLREGDTVELAGRPWQVLETPGHAGTHLTLVRDDGTALVGDTLLERISSNALAEPPYPGQTGRPSSMLAYRRTLRRLAELPLGLLLPGHGNPFSAHAALIARRLQGQEERAGRLLDGLRQGHETVVALMGVLFPALAENQTFLGLSEVLGHLDILEEQGRARHEGDDPARYFPTASRDTGGP